MEFYDIVYKAAGEQGLSIEKLSLKLGKTSRYIGGSKSRGSLPKVNNAAMILDACGYTLCAIPSDSVPDDAIPVDF